MRQPDDHDTQEHVEHLEREQVGSTALFAVGEMVSYKEGRGILHCGSGTYERAVVASMNPFILVSEWGDMKWQSTVNPEDFESAGEANREELIAVLDRFRRELHPAND